MLLCGLSKQALLKALASLAPTKKNCFTVRLSTHDAHVPTREGSKENQKNCFNSHHHHRDGQRTCTRRAAPKSAPDNFSAMAWVTENTSGNTEKLPRNAATTQQQRSNSNSDNKKQRKRRPQQKRRERRKDETTESDGENRRERR